MTQWFSCDIMLDFSVESHGEEKYYSIASCPSDPGFQVGDRVKVNDATITKKYRSVDKKRIKSVLEPRFSFDAIVKKREGTITVDSEVDGEVIDYFNLFIYLEIADKEQVPEIIQAIRDFEDKSNQQELQ